jgi:hypothetical protein
MAVLVKNERSTPFYWTTGKRGQADKQIAPGEVAVLSENEWQEIPISMRGPGGLRPLDPSPQDEDSLNVTELDYYSVDAQIELRYLGEAPQGSDPTSAVWTVKRFSHMDVAGDPRISEVQVLNEVAWGVSTADRDGLPWL